MDTLARRTDTLALTVLPVALEIAAAVITVAGVDCRLGGLTIAHFDGD